MRIPLLAAVALGVFSTVARADVAPSPVPGGSNPRVINQKSVDVVMTREDVTVTVSDGYAVVDATFVLTNEGKAQEMEVGFPGQGVMVGTGYSAHQALYGFAAWVDDAAVKTDAGVKEERVQAGPKMITRRETWHTFKVAFPSGKAVKVRVQYGVVAEEHYPIGGRAQNAPMDLEAWYIVNTGSRWKGPIGEAVITFKAGGAVDKQSLRMVNHGPVPGLSSKEKYEPYKLAEGVVKQVDGSLVLTRKAWEPKASEDLQVVFRPDLTTLPMTSWGRMEEKKVAESLMKALGR